jgi:MFS family permease
MTPAPSTALRDLPPAYRWLLGGMFVSALATFVFPFLALYLRARGFSVAQAGLVAGLFGAGSVVSGPRAGWSADRLGRRPTILLALLASATLTALLGWI